MNRNNRFLGLLLTIIFVMVCSLNVYSASVEGIESDTPQDLLKDATRADDRNVALWNDAVLPVQVCLPRQVQSMSSFGPSPFLLHFIVFIPKYQYFSFTHLSYKARGSSPFRSFLSRFYYVIALERFIC